MVFAFDFAEANRMTCLANSELVAQIGFAANGQTVMTTTKQYDNLNRLTNIQSAVGSSVVAASAYQYNLASQRTTLTNADNSLTTASTTLATGRRRPAAATNLAADSASVVMPATFLHFSSACLGLAVLPSQGWCFLLRLGSDRTGVISL